MARYVEAEPSDEEKASVASMPPLSFSFFVADPRGAPSGRPDLHGRIFIGELYIMRWVIKSYGCRIMSVMLEAPYNYSAYHVDETLYRTDQPRELQRSAWQRDRARHGERLVSIFAYFLDLAGADPLRAQLASREAWVSLLLIWESGERVQAPQNVETDPALYSPEHWKSTADLAQAEALRLTRMINS